MNGWNSVAATSKTPAKACRKTNMLVPLQQWCVSCGHQFHAGTVTAPLKEHTQHATVLYGSNHQQWLCNRCSEHERQQEEEKGTNDIPELLATYAKSSWDKPK